MVVCLPRAHPPTRYHLLTTSPSTFAFLCTIQRKVMTLELFSAPKELANHLLCCQLQVYYPVDPSFLSSLDRDHLFFSQFISQSEMLFAVRVPMQDV